MSITPNAESKTLILTGASRGIGHATVKRFASAGWRVITCSRHPFPENCPWEMGPRITSRSISPIPRTRSRPSAEMRVRLEAQGGAAERARQQCGHLAKGAGGARLGTIDTAARGLAARVPGEFLRAHHAGARPPRRAGARQRRGRQCHVDRRRRACIRSRARPMPHRKRRSPRLTREMAGDFGPRGVRVNAISPGEIDTAILSPGTDRIVREQIPLRRLGEPEEVAKAIYFLCTDAVELRQRRRAAHQWRPACLSHLACYLPELPLCSRWARAAEGM